MRIVLGTHIRSTDLALLTTLVLPLLPACAETHAANLDWSGTVDTLPSGVVWVANGDDPLWAPSQAWTLEEDLRIGSLDSGGPDQFGAIGAIHADEAGTIHVVDRQSHEIRVFAPDGTPVRTLGREGDGPAEFRDPWGVDFSPSGDLWVVDVHGQRVSVFGPDGSFRRTYPRAAAGFSWPWPGRFLRDGTFLEPDFGAEGHRLFGHLVEDDQLVVSDTFPAPLGTVPESDYDIYDLTDDRGVGRILAVPFGRRWHWALDAAGGVWVGHSREYRIARQTLEGDTVLLIGRDPPRIPVELRERSAAIAGLGESRSHPQLDLSRIPETKPWFDALLPAPDGTLWVLRQVTGPSWAFDVFDQQGRFLGSVPLPLEPAPFPPPRILHDAVLLVTRNALDVPFVVRMAIRRPF